MPSVGPGAGASLWTPRAVPSSQLFAWYDPSQTASLAVNSSNVVATARDLSPSGIHLTSSGSPTTGRWINNNNAIDCTGTQQLNATTSLAQPFTTFCAFYDDTVTTGGAPTIFGGGTGSAYLAYHTNSNKYGCFFGTARLESTAATTVGAHVVVVVANGASSELWLDLASPVTGNPGTTGISRLAIMSRGDATDTGDGAFCEGFVLRGVATRDVILAGRNYLLSKFAVAPVSPPLVFT